MFGAEVGGRILTFSSNRELARRGFGTCCKHWLHVHREHAWSNLVLAAVQKVGSSDADEEVEAAPDVELAHATVQQFASAPASLQMEIGQATQQLTLFIVHFSALTAYYKTFVKSPFTSVKALVIHGVINGYGRSGDCRLDEFKWAVIFSPMFSTVKSITMKCGFENLSSAMSYEVSEEFGKTFINSFVHLRRLDLVFNDLPFDNRDDFPFELLEVCQGIKVHPFTRSTSWLTRAPNLRYLSLCIELCSADELQDLFSLLAAVCLQLRGLKISFCDVMCSPDVFGHLPVQLEKLVLQFDSDNEIPGVISRHESVSGLNAGTIAARLRPWLSSQCSLVVQDECYFETLESCMGFNVVCSKQSQISAPPV